jgi:hypothetical protein
VIVMLTARLSGTRTSDSSQSARYPRSLRPPGNVHCDRRVLASLDAVWLRHGAEPIRQTVVMAELEVLLSVATGDGTAGVLRDEDGAVWLSWRSMVWAGLVWMTTAPATWVSGTTGDFDRRPACARSGRRGSRRRRRSWSAARADMRNQGCGTARALIRPDQRCRSRRRTLPAASQPPRTATKPSSASTGSQNRSRASDLGSSGLRYAIETP